MPKRIAIVEDEAELASLIDYNLARNGYQTEVLTEAEGITLGTQSQARIAIDIGQEFLRFLLEQGAGATVPLFIAAYPFAPDLASPVADDEEREYLSLMARGIPDGGALWEAMTLSLTQPTPTLPPTPTIDPAIRGSVLIAAQRWRSWAQGLFSGGRADQAWTAERLEYQFAVSAQMPDGLDLTLEAAQQPGGAVDWDAFDARPGASLGNPATPAAPVHVSAAAIPGLVTFPGMAAMRFWEFEDGGINFAAVSAGPEDLVRLALLDFHLIYGNDWFLVPLPVPVGTAVRIASLTVVDTFGTSVTIPHYSQVDAAAQAAGAWQMYRVSETDGMSQPGVAQSLLLPPIVAAAAESDPVEEVEFQRDDMAAMAWAIEAIIEGQSGRALRRQEAYQRNYRQPAPGAGGSLAFRLVTEVPDYWIPLVPVTTPTANNPAAVRLQRAAMLDAQGGVLALPALGRILDPSHELKLFDEEVPRDGVAVTRTYSAARWTNGAPLVWAARRKRPRRPEKPSGLRFDVGE